MSTIILHNGSCFAGEEPDNIKELLEILKTETIEERFFSPFILNKYNNEKRKYTNMCPIKEKDGEYTFFGNFERLSHVFHIITTNKDIIKPLSDAIKRNDGWIKYYEKNLVDENGNRLYITPEKSKAVVWFKTDNENNYG